MQNCTITSPYRRCVFYTTKFYGGAFITTLYEGTLPDYTAEPLWGAFEFFCGEWAFYPHTFFNYQTGRGRRAKQNSSDSDCPASLHTLQVTRSSYSVERAMEVLLQDCTGRTCYQTVRGHTRATENFTSAFLIITRLTRATHYQTARWRRRARGRFCPFFRLPDCMGATNPMTTAAAFFPTATENRSF